MDKLEFVKPWDRPKFRDKQDHIMSGTSSVLN